MGVSKKYGYPKMDGENTGKPYEQMDDLGKHPYFRKHPYRCFSQMVSLKFKNSCNCSTFHTSLGIAVPSGVVNFFWPPGSASFAYRTALGISRKLAQIQSSIRSK